ncbi:MAG TPA: hypothetical protein VGC41_29255 [Kofleriaceae bacterium]
MTNFYKLAAPIIALAMGCDSDRTHSTQVFAKTAGEARSSFEDKKQVRLLGIHVERSMIGSQPEMIGTFADQLPVADHSVLDAKVKMVSDRMRDADAAIDALELATPDVWNTRDTAATDAMKRLEAARDDAWNTLKAATRVDTAS